MHQLKLIFVSFGRQMHINYEVVIRDQNCWAFGPIQILNLFLCQDISNRFFGFKDALPCNDKFVFGIISDQVISIGLFQFLNKKRRILLYEENIGIDFCETAQKFIEFFFLTQERQLIEGSVDVQIKIWWVFNQFLKIILFKCKCQQSMVENEIVQLCCLSLSLVIRYFFCQGQLIEYLVPPSLKLLPSHQSIVFYADVQGKCRAETTQPNLLIYFSHPPRKFLFFVVREVQRQQSHEDFTDLNQLFLKVLAVEFKGVVHDVTVVESGYNDRSLIHILR